MRSEATSVKEYLDGLPEDRRKAMVRVRSVIRKKLPRGFKEVMNWGMVTYEVPLKTYADTYNGKPLMSAAADPDFVPAKTARSTDPVALSSGTG